MNNPHISVIIPSYNSDDVLRLCLKALLGQSGAVSYEILVVDSSPNSDIMKIAQGHDKVKVIKLKERSLPGIARNLGADKARGRVLVFVDADVLLKSDGIAQIWDYYGKGYQIFGGALELAPESHMPCGLIEHYYFNHGSLAKHPLSLRKNLSSALMIIDSKVFKEVGGFKNIPRMQDTELTERMSREGKKLYFIPSVLGHQVHDSACMAVLKKAFISGNNLYFIRYAPRTSFVKKLLFFAGLPLITLAKVTRINARNIAYRDGGGRVWAIALIPVMYFCGLFWMAGFYKALLRNTGISKER